MNTDFLNGLPVEVDITFRLLLAYLLGGVIGWDREKGGQAAGMRTHLLVAIGSAGFTMVFLFAFRANDAETSRAISQIITGIGFLGAGVIWQNRRQPRGITTAAGIWTVSAIGMLAAVGMWYLATILTVLSFVTLRWLRPDGAKLREKKRLRIENAKLEKSQEIKAAE